MPYKQLRCFSPANRDSRGASIAGRGDWSKLQCLSVRDVVTATAVSLESLDPLPFRTDHGRVLAFARSAKRVTVLYETRSGFARNVSTAAAAAVLV